MPRTIEALIVIVLFVSSEAIPITLIAIGVCLWQGVSMQELPKLLFGR